ncbi:hypothetical protein RFI_21046 [Reticulomyxa filosa]|uniref:Uncharacterized protein n=1 Tax=Reticulomyxa filosa TaxID=46433 RepID=X6MQM5_RETFI|nr:hypothetical protein RFI_21046 [Reticulomyxa filosa]|eukprot:ETO16308.1 hypothetical protein RFI_21046 [Reticulomyxa filosa]
MKDSKTHLVVDNFMKKFVFAYHPTYGLDDLRAMIMDYLGQSYELFACGDVYPSLASVCEIKDSRLRHFNILQRYSYCNSHVVMLDVTKNFIYVFAPQSRGDKFCDFEYISYSKEEQQSPFQRGFEFTFFKNNSNPKFNRKIVDVTCGYAFTLFLDSDWNVYGIGDNNYGLIDSGREMSPSSFSAPKFMFCIKDVAPSIHSIRMFAGFDNFFVLVSKKKRLDNGDEVLKEVVLFVGNNKFNQCSWLSQTPKNLNHFGVQKISNSALKNVLGGNFKIVGIVPQADWTLVYVA